MGRYVLAGNIPLSWFKAKGQDNIYASSPAPELKYHETVGCKLPRRDQVDRKRRGKKRFVKHKYRNKQQRKNYTTEILSSIGWITIPRHLTLNEIKTKFPTATKVVYTDNRSLKEISLSL